jgi:endonuclease VIII
MPEGDTIYRTATSLRRWLAGRQVTAVLTSVPGLSLDRLIGASVTSIESQGKHLLIRFSNGDTLHTHMRMTGSWHVYSAGERWRRAVRRANVVLEAGDRVAVCFDVPVVELLATRAERVHPALAGLGQDLLSGHDLDRDGARTRARLRAEQWPLIGDLLLDQRVVAGIGNIYRCETLFQCRIDPWAPVDSLADADLDQLLTTAARLLKASAMGSGGGRTRFEGRPDRPWVYRRAGRPCRQCGTVIKSARLGRQARTVYWCPTCQTRMR